jgi:hypothetical protein
VNGPALLSETGEEPRGGSWWQRFDGPRRGPLLLGLLVCVPIIVAQIKLVGRLWYPGGDMAQAELHVRGLWGHPPLVGAAGRIAGESGLQGSHPGPSLWLAMWPVYALFGRSSRGLMLSVGAFHIATAMFTLWLARRRGGTTLMISCAVVLALIVRASGFDFATEPWNPWMAVLPFAALVMLCWSMLDGERWAWPGAVVVGSHCIQSHAGYALVVLAMLATTTVLAGWQAIRSAGERPEAHRRARWLGPVAAVGAGVLVWLPPLLDQWRRSPGNITLLIEHFGSPTEPYITKRDALRIIANQFNLFGPWIEGREALAVNRPGLIAVLAIWAAAVVVVVRVARTDRAPNSLLLIHVVLASGVFAGVASVVRVFGGYFEYTVRWWWVLTGLIVAISASSLVPLAIRRPSRRSGSLRLGHAALAALIGVGAVSGVGAAQAAERTKLPGAPDSRIVGGLMPGLVDGIEATIDPTVSRREDPKFLLRWFDPQYLGASAFGLLLELERQGLDVRVDPAFAAAALPHRTVAEEDADGGVLWLVIGQRIDAVRATPGVVEMAYYDTRSPQDALRSAVVRATLTDRFDELGRPELADQLDQQYGLTSLLFAPEPLPADIAALVVEYLELGQPAAVFLVPTGFDINAV